MSTESYKANISRTLNITVEQIQALPRATIMDMRQRGGNFMGVMRERVKSIARMHDPQRGIYRGDEVTWGTPQYVCIQMNDLEEMTCAIAAYAIDDYLKHEEREAATRRGHETWPGWEGDCGELHVPFGYRLQIEMDSQRWCVAIASTNKVAEGTDPRGYDTRDEANLAAWSVALKAKRERQAAEAQQVMERG